MATIVFSGGHTLRVDGTKEQLRQMLTGPVGAIDGGWTLIRSGDDEALINPKQVAYIVDDSAVPEVAASRSPFYSRRLAPEGSAERLPVYGIDEAWNGCATMLAAMPIAAHLYEHDSRRGTVRPPARRTD